MKKRLIIPSVILIIAVLLSVGTYFYRLEQYKGWITAPGVVTEVTFFQFGFDHRIHYAYIADGANYTGSKLSVGKTSSFKSGDPHEIWFDPENPVHSSFNKPKPGLDPIVPLMFGSFLAIASYRFAKENEKMSRLC